MEIKIIDNSGIRQLLAFDYRNAAKQLDFNDVIKLIRKSFSTQFEKVASLFPANDDFCLKVNLEQEKKNINYDTLASFSRDMSTNSELVFYMYYTSVKEVANFIIDGNGGNVIQHRFEDTILHELIHGADLKTLMKTGNLQNNDIRLNKRVSGLAFNDLRNDSLNHNTQWAFLSAMEIYRNEGIAVLGEKLLGSESVSFSNNDLPDYQSVFKTQMDEITSLSVNLEFSNNNQCHEILTRIHNISMSAYAIGDLLMILILMELHPEKANLFQGTLSWLEGGSERKPVKEESIELLQLCFTLDMSDYLNGLLRIKDKKTNNRLVNLQNLLRCCAFIQHEENDKGISSFARTLMAYGYNGSANEFLKVMEDAIGSCMKNEEIKELAKSFLENKYEDDITESIKRQVNYLLPLATDQSNAIAKWALTYLLDEQDLIHDEVAILGWQDDWMVLNAAIEILKRNR